MSKNIDENTEKAEKQLERFKCNAWNPKRRDPTEQICDAEIMGLTPE